MPFYNDPWFLTTIGFAVAISFALPSVMLIRTGSMVVLSKMVCNLIAPLVFEYVAQLNRLRQREIVEESRM